MDTSLKTVTFKKKFSLVCGESMEEFTLAYSTYGELSPQKDNVIWVFQSFTMDSQCALWWSNTIGEGKTIDTNKYFVVCVNTPGSCYGSTGPLSLCPKTQQPYYYRFPLWTTLDMVRAFEQLADDLGIAQIQLGIGASIGGMQALEWAIDSPDRFISIMPISVGARASAWAKASHSTQRMCIELDPSWGERKDDAGIEGMKIARAIALMNYRNYDIYERTQQDDTHDLLEQYKAESYQKYQGEKLARRFNAFSYYALCKTFEAYDLGRNFNSIEAALSRIKAHTLVLGIKEDGLFPVEEQAYLAQHIPNAELLVLNSIYGHDAFLLEKEALNRHIIDMLQGIYS